MNEQRKATLLRDELRRSYKNGGCSTTDSCGYMVNRDKETIKEELAKLPHIPNKKEGKIIRRLKKESGIMSTEEIYAKYGVKIASELNKKD